MHSPLSIGVILPHSKLFGGVKRFFELGEIFISRGHMMTIFTPDGLPADWCHFNGKVEKLSALPNYALDALFLTEPVFLNDMLKAGSSLKIFYHVGPRASLKEVLKHKEIILFVNSENMYLHDKKKYGVEAIRAKGGVKLPEIVKMPVEHPRPFVVMCYGRLSRKGKGTGIVVKAVKSLYKSGYDVKLLLFDSPIDEKGKLLAATFNPGIPYEFVLNHPVEKNDELFKKADVFVAVEKKGGWSNTAAEALAAGIPLIASDTGSKDFLVHNETGIKVWRNSWCVKKAILRLMKDYELRKKLSSNGRKKMESLDWNSLADFILNFIQERLYGISR